MSYLIDPNFRALCEQGKGWWEARRYAPPGIFNLQFTADKYILYGALVTSLGDLTNHPCSRHTVLHSNKGDGHLAWYEFLSEYDSEIYKEHKIAEYRSALDIPYHKNYPEGIPGYLAMVEKAYADLDCVDPTFEFHVPIPDIHKASHLKDKFAAIPRINDQIYREHQNWLRDPDKTFKKFIRQIRSWVIFQNPSQEFGRRALTGETNEYSSSASQDDRPSERRANYANRPYGNGNPTGQFQARPSNPLHIPQDAVRALSGINKGLPNLAFGLRRKLDEHDKALAAGKPPPESLIDLPPFEEIYQLLKEARKREKATKSDDTKPAAITQTTSKTLPSQYGNTHANAGTTYDDNAHNTESYEELMIDYAETQDPPMSDSEDESDTRSAHIVRTYTMRIDFDQYTRAHNATQAHQHVSIVDGGADSMILGTGWLFDNIQPSRTINIIGFNENHATKRGCAIGTGYAVIQDITGKEYLAVAHHAVQNAGSRTSLLSEAQMRHHGIIVDCTPTQFLGIDNKPGTQSLQIPYQLSDPTVMEKAHIHLTVRAALMTCPHRLPTDDDMRTLPRLQLTSQELWDPHSIYDDQLAIPILHDHRTLGYHTSSITRTPTEPEPDRSTDPAPQEFFDNSTSDSRTIEQAQRS
jgi:hypothetical protein